MAPHWELSVQGLDKDKTAIGVGRDFRISPKKCREVAHTIKGMPLNKAKSYLEKVILTEKPVPFRRFHKKIGQIDRSLYSKQRIG